MMSRRLVREFLVLNIMISLVFLTGCLSGNSSLIAVTDTGIGVDNFPAGIAFNPINSKIYVTNQFSNTVSVINTQTDEVESRVSVGLQPYGIAVDPLTNRIFVTNIESNTVSIIDGPTNEVVNSINLPKPVGIAVNPAKSLVYVTNIDDDTITVIDEVSRSILDNVLVGDAPYAIDVYRPNSITDLIYVTNPGSDTVSVINSSRVPFPEVVESKVIKNISVGVTPAGIAVDHLKGLVYVTNKDSHTVSIIGTSTNTVIKTIGVGVSPVGVAVNHATGVAYVSNTMNNIVSVIDSSTSSVNKNISVNSGSDIYPPVLPAILSFPNIGNDIAINTFQNIIYVSSTRSNMISVINGTVNESVVGVMIKISPPGSGSLNCNERLFESDSYVRYPYGTKLECHADPNSGFETSSETLRLDAISFGDEIAANFNPVLSIDQNLAIIITYLAILAPVSAIVSLVTIIHRWKQKQLFDKELQRIDELSDDKNLQNLEKERKSIRDLIVREKINETQYSILKDRISDLVDIHNKNHQDKN